MDGIPKTGGARGEEMGVEGNPKVGRVSSNGVIGTEMGVEERPKVGRFKGDGTGVEVVPPLGKVAPPLSDGVNGVGIAAAEVAGDEVTDKAGSVGALAKIVVGEAGEAIAGRFGITGVAIFGNCGITGEAIVANAGILGEAITGNGGITGETID